MVATASKSQKSVAYCHTFWAKSTVYLTLNLLTLAFKKLKRQQQEFQFLGNLKTVRKCSLWRVLSLAWTKDLIQARIFLSECLKRWAVTCWERFSCSRTSTCQKNWLNWPISKKDLNIRHFLRRHPTNTHSTKTPITFTSLYWLNFVRISSFLRAATVIQHLEVTLSRARTIWSQIS